MRLTVSNVQGYYSPMSAKSDIRIGTLNTASAHRRKDKQRLFCARVMVGRAGQPFGWPLLVGGSSNPARFITNRLEPVGDGVRPSNQQGAVMSNSTGFSAVSKKQGGNSFLSAVISDSDTPTKIYIEQVGGQDFFLECAGWLSPGQMDQLIALLMQVRGSHVS